MTSSTHTSGAERRKQGKALREKCPRASQGEWQPRSKSHDIIKLLEESDADRIPGLIPGKTRKQTVPNEVRYTINESTRQFPDDAAIACDYKVKVIGIE